MKECVFLNPNLHDGKLFFFFRTAIQNHLQHPEWIPYLNNQLISPNSPRNLDNLPGQEMLIASLVLVHGHVQLPQWLEGLVSDTQSVF